MIKSIITTVTTRMNKIKNRNECDRIAANVVQDILVDDDMASLANIQYMDDEGKEKLKVVLDEMRKIMANKSG